MRLGLRYEVTWFRLQGNAFYFKLIPGNSIFQIIPLERRSSYSSNFGLVQQGRSEQKITYKLEYVDDTTDVFESDVVAQPSALGGGSP